MNKILRLCAVFIILFAFYSEGICQPYTGTSIIIFIHGDGDYLFHNKNGESLQADDAILNKAINAAEKVSNSEVFIFYQKKKEYSLLFFPKNDLDCYFFRDGKLIEKTSASRTNFSFADEQNFYKKYAAKGLQNILLYYGHEIPLKEGFGYNSSYTDQPFNLAIFNNAIKSFPGINKFDLIVLSTCNNGSPEVIEKLAPSAKYIIASPENLHLSYMNPEYLTKLNYYKNNFEDFVVDFAESSFNELKSHVETVCAVSAYKTEALSPVFMNQADKYSDNNKNNLFPAENCDCSELNNFNTDEASRGVIVFYNPPAFGKNKSKLEHSGWGCKKGNESSSFFGKPIGNLQSVLSGSKGN